MPRKHGSLREYIAAYARYDGKPPIPAEADERRGDERPSKAWVAVGIVTMLVGGIPPLLLVGPGQGSLAEAAELAAFGVSMLGVSNLLMMFVGAPVLDWYEDVPRRGLPRVDARYGPVEVTDRAA